MTNHGDQRPLATFIPTPPVLGAQWDPRAPDADDEPAAELKGILNTLYASRRLIAGVTALITAAAVIYALVADPVYESNLLIQVEQQSPSVSKIVLPDSSAPFDARLGVNAEMELLRSRMVVTHAIDQVHLDIDVRPKYFPIASFWFVKQETGALSTPGLFGYGGYVWGSEHADVSIFNIPPLLINQDFTLIAQGGGRYRLAPAGQPYIFEGSAGKIYEVQTSHGTIDVRVDAIYAKPGAVFYVKRRSRLETIEAIQRSLVISEEGKQSGIIQVSLEGANPQKLGAFLSELGAEYIRQNNVRKNEETAKSLAFLDTQLPVSKHEVDEATSRYNQFREAHGTVNVREESRIGLEQATSARNRRNEIIQKKNELLARFTENHPVVVALDRQRKEVDAEIDEIARRIKRLPALEQDEVRLTRDIQANTDSYAALSSTSQRLKLVSASHVSNVRMVDAPVVPETPLKPYRLVIVAASAVAGLSLGIVLALARKALAGGIDDPFKVERQLGARVVYAVIPHSVMQDRLMRKAWDDAPLLAQVAPEDPVIETLRSFRVTLQFSMPHFKNNVVMLAGATRHLGRSFLVANLAAIVAASGKRVLLIDADMRYGQLHHFLGLQRDPGLSNAIAGSVPGEEVIHHNVVENLDFIGAGTASANRPDFLLDLNFGTLLESLSPRYDLVFIDSPPILGVADALIIGAHAGSVFLVARSGTTTKKELNESIKQLNYAGILPRGVLFNDMAQKLSLATSVSSNTSNARLGFSSVHF